MKTSKTISLALALALGSTIATGCAADSSANGGDDDGGGGGGGGGGDVTPANTDFSGTYSMRSTFDLATNMPGKVGDVVNTIIAATDGGADPADWILEQVINQMPAGTLKNLLNGARPFVAGFLNDRLLAIAPDFVDTMILVGHDFGAMAKNFGLNEQIVVTGSAGTYMANKSELGAHFKIDQAEIDLAFADYHVANVDIANVGMTLDATNKLTIAEHKVPLTYGKVLRIGLDGAIIPLIDPTASDLGTLLAHQVDCTAVGQAIADAIGFGGASTFSGACTAGLGVGANFIYSKIDAIDGSALEFTVAGTAKVLDKNGDKKFDTIQTGAWSGTLSYASTPSPLAPATFFGERM